MDDDGDNDGVHAKHTFLVIFFFLVKEGQG
jgi:hypothetical protein